MGGDTHASEVIRQVMPSPSMPKRFPDHERTSYIERYSYILSPVLRYYS